ncbi:MAG: sigma-70 family RNA polymerase sigma factor [Phycisphaeraceae bacterium]|nr:sigma-70 family RNA polymerase sigma factor [Phycisphaeraceae bacterium]
MIEEKSYSVGRAGTGEGRVDSARAETELARAGERLAQHGDVLWRFVIARTRSHEMAEDVVQETFLAAMESETSFSGLSSERTWLLAIAAHKIADQFRERRKSAARGRALESEDEPAAGPGGGSLHGEFTARGKWARPPAKWAKSLDDPEESAELLAALRNCVGELPPTLAEAIWMRDLLDIPSQEVCKSMGVTPTNLWSRTHRARSLLRRCVERMLGLEKDGRR